jgi:hypothetical protein
MNEQMNGIRLPYDNQNIFFFFEEEGFGRNNFFFFFLKKKRFVKIEPDCIYIYRLSWCVQGKTSAYKLK